MKCPHCKGSVSAYNFFKEKHCPACGEVLKRMPTKEQIKETLIIFAEDRGYLFWSIIYWLAVWVIAFVEQLAGQGMLFEYILHHKIRFFCLALFSGSIIDYVIKANVEVTAVRNKFIFKPPIYLRRYRNWTNIFLIIGLGLSAYTLYRWPNYVGILPTVTFLTSFCLGVIWALMGLVLTSDDLNDKRIRYFLQEMRIDRLRIYHRVSMIYLGGIFVSVVVYYKLVHISGLSWYIMNARIVYNTVTFFKNYFGWVDKFIN